MTVNILSRSVDCFFTFLVMSIDIVIVLVNSSPQTGRNRQTWFFENKAYSASSRLGTSVSHRVQGLLSSIPLQSRGEFRAGADKTTIHTHLFFSNLSSNNNIHLCAVNLWLFVIILPKLILTALLKFVMFLWKQWSSSFLHTFDFFHGNQNQLKLDNIKWFI